MRGKFRNIIYHGYKTTKVLSLAYLIVFLIYTKCMIGGLYVIKKEVEKNKN